MLVLYYTSLEMLARDHSSFWGPFVSHAENEVILALCDVIISCHDINENDTQH
jgi:hypothetical protein